MIIIQQTLLIIGIGVLGYLIGFITAYRQGYKKATLFIAEAIEDFVDPEIISIIRKVVERDL